MDNKTTIFKLVSNYDAPYGLWYECQSCKKESFVPEINSDGNKIDSLRFCPYCGKEITKFT